MLKMEFKESYVDELQKDLKVEFFNLDYLSTNFLDTPNKALDYFYTSPFFESGSLNDLILLGHHVDPKQDGEIYEIVEDNLAWISSKAPENAALRHVYFNENSIFVIQKVLRKTTIHCTNLIPIKVFYIMSGRIYRVTSLADVCRYRMYNAVRHLENCFDMMESMSTWSLVEGYGWKAKMMRNQQKYIDFIKQNFSNKDNEKDEKERPCESSIKAKSNNKLFLAKCRKEGTEDDCVENANIVSKGENRDDFSDYSCSLEEKFGLSEKPNLSSEKKSDLDFTSPLCDLALRMCQTELKHLWTEKNMIDKQLEKFEAEKQKLE